MSLVVVFVVFKLDRCVFFIPCRCTFCEYENIIKKKSNTVQGGSYFLIAECKKRQIILISRESKSHITKNTSDNCDLSKSNDLGLKMPQTRLESINH